MYNAIVMGVWGLRDRNGEISNFPNLAINYPPSPELLKVESISQNASHLPSNPNLNTWAIVCSGAMLAIIEADNNYLVLSSEEIINETI